MVFNLKPVISINFFFFRSKFYILKPFSLQHKNITMIPTSNILRNYGFKIILDLRTEYSTKNNLTIISLFSSHHVYFINPVGSASDLSEISCLGKLIIVKR